MTDEYAGFASARARLEEITAQVRDKDTPLERCLDLLEEGVRIANRCTELLDHTEWRTVVEEQEAGEAAVEGDATAAADAEGADADTEASEPGDADGEDADTEASEPGDADGADDDDADSRGDDAAEDDDADGAGDADGAEEDEATGPEGG